MRFLRSGTAIAFLASPLFTGVALGIAAVTKWLAVYLNLDDKYELSYTGLDFTDSITLTIIALAVLINTAVYLGTIVSNGILRKDLYYKRVKYYWAYEKDGTISGVAIFCLHNRGAKSISDLPKESLIWFRRPEKEHVKFRLIMRDGGKAHSFEEASYTLTDSDKLVIGLKSPKEFRLAWAPRIFPPLSVGETLEYEAEIETKKTEVDAFAPTGSVVGFPVHHRANEIELVTRSPSGWRFELVSPSFVVSDILTGEELSHVSKNLSAPILDGDGSIMSWKIKHPVRGARYLISYRFVAK